VRWVASHQWDDCWRAALIPDVQFRKAVEIWDGDTDIAQVEVWVWV
jgi:hypothetical protein